MNTAICGPVAEDTFGLLGEYLLSDGEDSCSDCDSDVDEVEEHQDVVSKRRGSDAMYLPGGSFPLLPSIKRSERGGRLTRRRESSDDDYIVGLTRENSELFSLESPQSKCPVAVSEQQATASLPAMEELDVFSSTSTLPACLIEVTDTDAVTQQQAPCHVAIREALCVDTGADDFSGAVFKQAPVTDDFAQNSCVVLEIPSVAVIEQALGESSTSLPVSTFNVSFLSTDTFDTLPVVMVNTLDDIDILSCDASDIITSPTHLRTQYDYERFGSMILANGWVDETDGEETNPSIIDDGEIEMYEMPISPLASKGAFYQKNGFGYPIAVELPLSPSPCYRPAELPMSPCNGSSCLIPTIFEDLPKLTKESLALHERLSVERQNALFASALLENGWVESTYDASSCDSCPSPRAIQLNTHILSCDASDIITSPTHLQTQYDYERFGSMMLANGWVDETDGEDSIMSEEEYELALSGGCSLTTKGAFYRKRTSPMIVEIPLSPCMCFRPMELPISRNVSPSAKFRPSELPISPSSHYELPEASLSCLKSTPHGGISPVILELPFSPSPPRGDCSVSVHHYLAGSQPVDTVCTKKADDVNGYRVGIPVRYLAPSVSACSSSRRMSTTHPSLSSFEAYSDC